MVSHILLVNWPAKSRENLRDFPKGRDLVNAEVKRLGGTLTRFFTQGPYDAVVHLDMPTEEAAMKVILFVNSLGVKTTTMRSFTEDEFVRMLGQIPPR